VLLEIVLAEFFREFFREVFKSGLEERSCRTVDKELEESAGRRRETPAKAFGTLAGVKAVNAQA